MLEEREGTVGRWKKADSWGKWNLIPGRQAMARGRSFLTARVLAIHYSAFERVTFSWNKVVPGLYILHIICKLKAQSFWVTVDFLV